MPNIMRGIRRILVEFGSYPSELSESVSRIHSSGNPFGEPREKRGAWAEEMEVQAYEPGMEYLYSPCCVPSYDPRVVHVAKATVNVLRTAGITFGVLGDGEACCGEAIRRAGAEEVFQEVAAANIAAFSEAGVRRTVVTSPHCLRPRVPGARSGLRLAPQHPALREADRAAAAAAEQGARQEGGLPRPVRARPRLRHLR
jgi:Fe-S oxidoreductase